MPKLVVVFYGRFQPPHLGHIETYKDLAKKFGSKNVYVATSDKTDPDRSPLPFKVKTKLLQNLGIPASQILKTRRNYNADEIKQVLGLRDFSDFIFVVAVGEKDASRLGGGKFFQEFPRSKKDLQTADQTGYYFVRRGKMRSATKLRDVLRQDELSAQDLKFLMQQTGLKKRGVMQLKKLVEHQQRKKTWGALLNGQAALLSEGGAGGHMLHPFEDLTMSFGEMKSIIEASFDGQLDVVASKGGGDVREKTDGQNLFATVIDGKVRFARNKTHLRNRGRNAMSIKDIQTKWADKPDIQAAFLDGGRALKKGFESLPQKVQDEIFGNGERWINFEVISQKNPNVINYDKDLIVFHDIQVVDINGTVTGVAAKQSAKLYKIFADAEKQAETKIPIQPPPYVRAATDMNLDFGPEKYRFLADIDRFAKKYGLGDSDTVGDAMVTAWNRMLDGVEDKYTVTIPPALRQKLIQRFVYGNKAYRITSLPKDLPDAAAIDAIKSMDKSSRDINKSIMEPLELTILAFGTELLTAMKKFIAASPEKSAAKLKADIDKQIATIRKSKNAEDIARMEVMLKKIQAAGGFDKLVPSEGLVFRYKGKIIKITGLFAPVNQLMGIGRFG